MTITAKYSGTCRKCGGHFEAGTPINWVKDQGSEHVTCPAQPAAAPIISRSSSARPAAQTKRCWECGGTFTYADAKRNDGDWQDSYCGC